MAREHHTAITAPDASCSNRTNGLTRKAAENVKETIQTHFKIPKMFPELSSGDVHVWHIPLMHPPDAIAHLQPLLSAEERERAHRFHFPKDQHQFIVSRGILRVLLGKYQDSPPGEFTFEYGHYGKPVLANPGTGPGIYFNVSHSHQVAIIGFCRECELGIDIEYFREMRELMRIARRFFSRHECTVLGSLAAARQVEGFFNCWTRKEAFIKASGEGLSHPLNTFSVTLSPGEPARLLWIEGDPGEASRWTLAAWNPATDYTAALAIRQTGLRIQHFSL